MPAEIIQFEFTDRDQQLLDALDGADSSPKPVNDDYGDVIVKKPWGYEYRVFDNGQVAIWMLQIARKRKTSKHCHPNKHTSLVVVSGDVVCSGLDEACELSDLQAVEIHKGAFHITETVSELSIYPPCESGSWVLEIESPVDKGDLVRAADSYGRQGKSYEGKSEMVPYSSEWLQLEEPGHGETFSTVSNGCDFHVVNGHFDGTLLADDANQLIAVIEYREQHGQRIDGLDLGRIYRPKDFERLVFGCDLSAYSFLLISKDKELKKLTDVVADFLADLGVRQVFSVSGGGAMHLVDSVGKHERLEYVATHHEQAAAMAAEAYARISGGIGAAVVTTGPGGTNALTGLAGAWIDSIPTIFVSGQVTRDTLLAGTGLRQFGIQECDIVTLVEPLTKYAVEIDDPSMIRYELEKAAWLAKSGRPGPVWIDIPLDIQSQQVYPGELKTFKPPARHNSLLHDRFLNQVDDVRNMLQAASRPILICGHGVRLADAGSMLRDLVGQLQIPVISSWTASDLFASDDDSYVGRAGIFGDRASNFAMQNADLLLIVGSRMSIPQCGYNYSTFARAARIAMVDIDENELRKHSLLVDLGIVADAGEFLRAMSNACADLGSDDLQIEPWRKRCREWKATYPVCLPEYATLPDKVNSFHFIDRLSHALPDDAVVVTDMGTSFTCTMQTFQTKLGQRLTTSAGHASMGFGLPGAIGACYANGRRKTICISGEGGLQMNIQELQTVVHNQLPIILFVINNGGYLTIKHMQLNHFNRYVGSESGSGVSCPDLQKIAAAYGIPACVIGDNSELHANLDTVLDQPGPYICEIMMPEDQPLIPRSSSLKKPDGGIVSKPLEDLYPFLDRDEFHANMIVDPTDVFD